jgi:hypothetical protein
VQVANPPLAPMHHSNSAPHLLPPPTHLSPYQQASHAHMMSPQQSRMGVHMEGPSHMMHHGLPPPQERDMHMMSGRERALSSASNGASKMRGKKIPVACNFCRCKLSSFSLQWIPRLTRRPSLQHAS